VGEQCRLDTFAVKAEQIDEENGFPSGCEHGHGMAEGREEIEPGDVMQRTQKGSAPLGNETGVIAPLCDPVDESIGACLTAEPKEFGLAGPASSRVDPVEGEGVMEIAQGAEGGQ
jgi:hypothetical protein